MTRHPSVPRALFKMLTECSELTGHIRAQQTMYGKKFPEIVCGTLEFPSLKAPLPTANCWGIDPHLPLLYRNGGYFGGVIGKVIKCFQKA